MILARYAVMGNPVAHSLSPRIHQLFARQTGIQLTYEKILVDIAGFEQQVENFFAKKGCGLNITLPFKQRAFAMSEKVSDRGVVAKAVNTLWMHEGRLHADNTDGVGLIKDLSRHVNVAGKAILLLGAGGAARGVLGPLLDAKPKRLTIVNRTAEKAHALQLDFLSANCCTVVDLAAHLETVSYDVVINATSASFQDSALNLPISLLIKAPFCYDLAYHENEETAFVLWARRFGCEAYDGLGMLVEQAAEAFFIWHGVMPDTAPILGLLTTNSHSKNN